MSRDLRQRHAAAAIASIDLVIADQRGRLAALERARDDLARIVAGDAADRCELASDAEPCAGLVHARWCDRCARLVRRCEAHGGARATARALAAHRATACTST